MSWVELALFLKVSINLLSLKNPRLINITQAGEKKYFDSGDYALSKAGKAQENDVGSEIPSPNEILRFAVSDPNKGGNTSPKPAKQ